MIENLYVPMELKFAGTTGADVGTFSGYGAVFGNVDDGGDMIVPGAFAASLAKLKAANRGIPMYMQHGAALGADPRPVGKWMVVEEDAHGLRVEGKLIGLDTETGRFNHALVKEASATA
jgi:HK97 family phage prohead protease